MRDFLAVSLLSLCVLLSTFLHLSRYYTLAWLREMSEELIQLGRTGESLKKRGVGAEEIGYVSDATLDFEKSFYYGLQYQLLPSVLVWSPNPALIVCHLHRRANLGGILRQNHLTVESDAGDGFLVLKHEGH